MSTIVGRPERIAAEFEIYSLQRLADEFDLRSTEQNDISTWIYGTMCLWAGGHRIGRHDELCAMTVAMAGFPSILRNKGKRSNPALMTKSARAVFRIVHRALYGAHENLSYRQLVALTQPFDCLSVLHKGFDVFDGWDAYLIEDGTVGRLIWRGPDRRIREVRIDAGEFDHMLDEFLTALENATGHKRREPNR
jgi:hypothetical protein